MALPFNISPTPGTINTDQITIVIQAPFQKILYFTFDGTCPNTNSARYGRPITFPKSMSPLTICILVVDVSDLSQEIYCVEYILI